jgi:hypothetical protein
MDYNAILSEYEKQKKIEDIKAILSGNREEEILQKIKEKKDELNSYYMGLNVYRNLESIASRVGSDYEYRLAMQQTDKCWPQIDKTSNEISKLEEELLKIREEKEILQKISKNI